MLRLDRLSKFEKDQLLRWFFHLLDMEGRIRLMTEMPLYYAKLVASSPHEWGVDIRDEVHNEARRGES